MDDKLLREYVRRSILIEQTEGTKKCKQCGAVSELKNAFCHECGEAFEGQSRGIIKCPRCGKVKALWRTHKFCSACGAKLNSDDKASQGGNKEGDDNVSAQDKGDKINDIKVDNSNKKSDITTAIEKKVTQKLSDKLGIDASDLLSDDDEKIKNAQLAAELKMVQKMYDKVVSKSVVVDIRDPSKRKEDEFLKAMKTAFQDNSAPNVIAVEVRDQTDRLLSSDDGWRAFLVGGKPTFLCIPKEIWNDAQS